LTEAPVGVVCALRSEARRLDPLADGLMVRVTGMGCGAAAVGAEHLVTAGAAALVSFGMAGGLDSQLSAGRIFLPSEVGTPEGTVLTTDREWRTRLCAALSAHGPVGAGRLVTTAAPVATVAAKAALFRATGASAVDMESVAIAQVAFAHGLPFVAIRVIVDPAEQALPHAVIAATAADGRTSTWRLLGCLLRSPVDAAPLARLARSYRRAGRSLAAVARSGAIGPCRLKRAAAPQAADIP
jgi:adenosylhomocysteine nucleosidase